MHPLLLSAASLCAATVFGSLIGFFIKELPHKWNDTVLGYCAGIILAASTVGLILPGFEGRGTMHWLFVGISVMVGAWFLNLLDVITPHLHHITGLDPEQHRANGRISHILLFVMAIALHKFPEGMAAGVSLNGGVAGSTDWTVTLGISIQNIPEGMVVIAPLLLAGVSRLRTFCIAVAIGLLEVVGVAMGYFLANVSQAFLPLLLAFAGGAMLYVTSDEMIPETHAHGYQKQATYALLLGFISLLLIE